MKHGRKPAKRRNIGKKKGEISPADAWFDARIRTIERSEELKRKFRSILHEYIGKRAKEIIYHTAKRLDCSPITTARYIKVETTDVGAYYLEGADLILRLR